MEEILRAAQELGYNTILHTNGVLLDRREKVLDHIARLVISVDPIDEGRFDSVTQSAPGTTRRLLEHRALWRHMLATRRFITIAASSTRAR